MALAAEPDGTWVVLADAEEPSIMTLEWPRNLLPRSISDDSSPTYNNSLLTILTIQKCFGRNYILDIYEQLIDQSVGGTIAKKFML